MTAMCAGNRVQGCIFSEDGIRQRNGHDQHGHHRKRGQRDGGGEAEKDWTAMILPDLPDLSESGKMEFRKHKILAALWELAVANSWLPSRN